jgi:ribulose-phosphate 3-epimerase
MPQIVPAILENTKEQFLDKISRVIKLPGLERIQVDFGDGEFVPNKILPIEQINTLNPAFHWEAHLMLKEPQDFLDYEISGFKTILIHYEAYKNKDDIKKALKSLKQYGFKAGVVVNPFTKISVLAEYKELADQFLIMGVNPGFQGQDFIEETIDRAAELRKLIPSAIIEVDGGVSLKNAKKLAKAGADLLVVGSALVKQPDILRVYEALMNEIKTT